MEIPFVYHKSPRHPHEANDFPTCLVLSPIKHFFWSTNQWFNIRVVDLYQCGTPNNERTQESPCVKVIFETIPKFGRFMALGCPQPFIRYEPQLFFKIDGDSKPIAVTPRSDTFHSPLVPSGKRSHNYWKIPAFCSWERSNYFDWAIFNRYVC